MKMGKTEEDVRIVLIHNTLKIAKVNIGEE